MSDATADVMSAATAYLAVGSNLGGRRRHLERALGTLQSDPCIKVTAVSALYETAPVGGPPGQPDYLNAVTRIETTVGPQRLLAVTQHIEQDMGRCRVERNGPRIIDIDILLFAGHVCAGPALTLPHPRMHERSFVLRPLADIAPDVLHPTLGRRIADLLDALVNPTSVRCICGAGWWRAALRPSQSE